MEIGGQIRRVKGRAGGPQGGAPQSMVYLKPGPKNDQRPCRPKGPQPAPGLGYRQPRQLTQAAGWPVLKPAPAGVKPGEYGLWRLIRGQHPRIHGAWPPESEGPGLVCLGGPVGQPPSF